MQRKIYSFWSQNGLESYFNLKNLIEYHPELSYMKIYRALNKESSVKTDTYTIYITTAKYKTNRGRR